MPVKFVDPESALRAALAADPKIDKLAEALSAAIDVFDKIKAKASDKGVEERARAAEETARHALVKAQALSEIGRASASEIEAARIAHRTAKEDLEMMGGREDVLRGELRNAQVAVTEAADNLEAGVEIWKNQVRTTAKSAAAYGAGLIRSAAMAEAILDRGKWVPENIPDYSDWLYHHDIRPDGLPELDVAPAATRALTLVFTSTQRKNEDLSTSQPRPKIPEQYPSYRASGTPSGVDSLNLGDPRRT